MAVAEGAQGIGNPADDNSVQELRRSPSVYYTIEAPTGEVVTNTNPSGTSEWERFVVSGPACACPADSDHVISEIQAGFYKMDIYGLDANNIDALRMKYVAFPAMLDGDASLGDTVWFDADQDGVYEPGAGELGIGGVTVTLYRDINLDGQIMAGEPLIGTTTTAADGSYLFRGSRGRSVHRDRRRCQPHRRGCARGLRALDDRR